MTSSIWPACSRKMRSIASRVADVGVLPAELGVLGDQPLGHVRGRGLGAEEAGPHVVLDPDDVEALGDEVLDGLGADQAPGPRDDRNRHSCLLPSPRGGVDVERLGDPLLVGGDPLVDVGQHLLGAAPGSPLVQAEELRAVGKVYRDVARRGSPRPASIGTSLPVSRWQISVVSSSERLHSRPPPTLTVRPSQASRVEQLALDQVDQVLDVEQVAHLLAMRRRSRCS